MVGCGIPLPKLPSWLQIPYISLMAEHGIFKSLIHETWGEGM
jgi:trehalose-6-phosphatase